MLQPQSQEWVGIASPLDGLYFPDLIVLDGATEGHFRVLAAPTATPDRPNAKNYLVTFRRTEIAYAYSETLYAEHAPERQTANRLSRASSSSLLDQARASVPAGEDLEHYVICGGNGCWEIVCEPEPVIQEYDTFNAAVAAASNERMQ